MKKFSCLFLLIVIANCVHAQGVNKYGQITTDATTYVNKNGGIGGTTGNNKNGQQVSSVTSVTSTTGRIWMDRNLGATQVATSSTDAASYGDLYQWGRGSDGHQIRTSTTTNTLSSTDIPGNALFITVSTSPYDWLRFQNVNLWQGVNGVNNPCPSGYRIPTETELNNERAIFSPQTSAGAFASPLKLPMAGYRGGTGSLNNVGTESFYWTSTTHAAYLFFSSNDADMNAGLRAFGFSVRCLKD